MKPLLQKSENKLVRALEKIARRERRRMTEIYGSPRGECYRWSMNLACSLKEAGYWECYAVYGHVKTKDSSLHPHHWLICKEVILDITADQFNSTGEKEFPGILVGPQVFIASHVKERCRWVGNW